MNDKDKLKPPKEGAGDHIHTAVSGGISLVPGLGGIIEKVFSAFLKKPIQKNLEIWRETMALAFQELEEKSEISIEKLENDPVFQTVFIQASMVAMRTHQEEKREALKNAVVNSACKIDIEEDLQMTYIRFIDELTPMHIKLLTFLIEHEGSSKEKRSEKLYIEFCKNLGNKINNDKFELFFEELRTRYLIYHQPTGETQSDFKQTRPGHGVLIDVDSYMLHNTDVGKDFLRFIAQENDNEDASQ